MNLRPVDNFEFSFVGRFVDFDSQGDEEIAGVGAVDGDGSTEGTQVYTRAQGRLNLLDDRWEQTLGLSYVRHRRDYLDDGDVTSHYEGETRRIDYQSDFSFETPSLLDASHVATFAIQHEDRAAISESAFSTFDRDISSTGFVGQYQATLFERLTLTGSLRHDRNELFEDTNTYRATAAFSIFETGTKLRASYGTGVKNPTLFELYGYTNTYRGNPDLEPEEARGWDVGFDQNFWNSRAMLDATYFEQRIDNLIQGTGESSINLSGETKVRGVELGLTAEVLENLTARASYTYTHGEDAAGEELVRRPKHLASLNLNYRFLEDRANLNLGVIYNGDQKDWAFNSDWTRRPVDMQDYVLVNLAASYRLNENAEIYGRVDNLLNEEYQEVYSYGTPGRAGYAGIRLRF
ncbi:TonB-dependent receptor plug domain-containing protein [Fodinicurvata halophila]